MAARVYSASQPVVLTCARPGLYTTRRPLSARDAHRRRLPSSPPLKWPFIHRRYVLSKTHRSHGSAPVAAAASSEAIGVEGLKALLSQASATLGRCRFIVVNAAAGGILEAVEDFGAGSLRYSQPSPKGQYMTIGNSTFECHLNVEKIATVVFATKQSPGDQSSADEDNVMYIMRFLNKDGGLALSVVLHRDTDGHGYDSDQSGNPSGWKELVNKYGETVTIQQA